MPDIIVIGAGIAGVPAAYELKRRLGAGDRLTVISDREYFHFVPSSPTLAVGWRTESDTAFPIKPYLVGRGIGFVHGSVTAIDADRARIVVDETQELTCDSIMIACGAVPRWQEIPGLAKLHSVLDLEQALATRQAYEHFVSRPGSIVIGAAPGASILGSLYEYAFSSMPIFVDAGSGAARQSPSSLRNPIRGIWASAARLCESP